jgi:hypothetical protein
MSNPKMIYVSDELNKKVKRLAFELNQSDKPIYEREIYIKAIEIGLEALIKKHEKTLKK